MSDEAQQSSSPPSSELAAESPQPTTPQPTTPQPTTGAGGHDTAAAPAVDQTDDGDQADGVAPDGAGKPTAATAEQLFTGNTGPAVFAHVLAIFPGVIGTGAYAKLSTDHPPFVRRHITEALNFSITMFIAYVATGLTVVGLLVWPLLGGIQIVLPVRAALAANQGKEFRYPATYRAVEEPDEEPVEPTTQPDDGAGGREAAGAVTDVPG